MPFFTFTYQYMAWGLDAAAYFRGGLKWGLTPYIPLSFWRRALKKSFDIDRTLHTWGCILVLQILELIRAPILCNTSLWSFLSQTRHFMHPSSCTLWRFKKSTKEDENENCPPCPLQHTPILRSRVLYYATITIWCKNWQSNRMWNGTQYSLI